MVLSPVCSKIFHKYYQTRIPVEVAISTNVPQTGRFRLSFLSPNGKRNKLLAKKEPRVYEKIIFVHNQCFGLTQPVSAHTKKILIFTR